MKKAVVSLAVGDRCLVPWRHYLSGNWSSWCHHNGYELVIFQSPLDHSPLADGRSLAWQKLLAMSSPRLLKYDFVFWLDADVLISPLAPDPFRYFREGQILMVRDVGSPLSDEPHWFKEAWSRILCKSLEQNHVTVNSFLPDPSVLFSYYQLWGFSSLKRPLYNTGFVGFSPSCHMSLFSDIYHRWSDGGIGSLHEMIPLNLEVIQRRLITEVPHCFNQLIGVHHAVWKSLPMQMQKFHSIHSPNQLTSNEFCLHMLSSSPFLHFAGAHKLMIDFFQYCESNPSLATRLSLGPVQNL
ncbi:hypothetical protein [Synechococcus sp. KORDI-100]|uniref:hypothetical protein n=1 Tax=Synechococcus sp. KORDI-100 TaxID=1280380 RepID=UPI000B240257|nr:hypothetical protein [Synechococcus sp. KORDI-100]